MYMLGHFLEFKKSLSSRDERELEKCFEVKTEILIMWFGSGRMKEWQTLMRMSRCLAAEPGVIFNENRTDGWRERDSNWKWGWTTEIRKIQNRVLNVPHAALADCAKGCIEGVSQPFWSGTPYRPQVHITVYTNCAIWESHMWHGILDQGEL